MDRKILHCDMNSFYASVELLEHPELRDVPVAVAGSPDSRHGIILAKNDHAKKYGVVTAETIASARKKCPDLHLLPPHHEKYGRYSELINKVYLSYTDMVEPFSVDESWLDVTASEKLFGPAEHIADEIRGKIKSMYGLTLSVGVSYNKIFAKMGSEYKKPDATTVITRENFRELLWPLPVGEFFFVGKSTAEKLKSYRILTVGDLARADVVMLKGLLGVHGEDLHRYVNGLDDSPVKRYDEREEAKSVGHGVTFRRDLIGYDDVSIAVTDLADRVSARLRRYGMKAGGVKVEITDPYFKRVSRQRKLSSPVNTSAQIKKVAMAIIGSMDYFDSPIRLITVTGINLVNENAAEQLTIFSIDENVDGAGGISAESKPQTARDEDLERTMDEIRRKYGKDAIKYAHVIDNDIGVDR